MKRILFLACFSAVIVIGGIAFQWPVEPGRLERNFGSSVPAFQRGISFKAAEGPVLAPHKGELVFAADGGNLPNGFPLPQGSIAAIAHDAGIISVITGIQTGSLASYRGVVEQGETIGLSPPASAGRSLLFYLYDSREKRYINPRILLPALDDRDPPLIRSVSCLGPAGEIPLAKATTLRQGEYFVLIDVVDIAPQGQIGAPLRLSVSMDGSERFKMEYESISSDAGRRSLSLAEQRAEGDFLMPDGRIRLGPLTLTRGKAALAVSAEDLAENRRELSFSITVQ